VGQRYEFVRRRVIIRRLMHVGGVSDEWNEDWQRLAALQENGQNSLA